MGNSLTLRLVAVVVLSLAPASIALALVASDGSIYPLWALLIIALGLVCGGLAALSLSRIWFLRAERLDSIADSLARHEMPTQLTQGERDPLGRAEQRLFEAAQSITSELESLDEQRDEFEAILRSMSEAVVVTGRRGDVMLLNGAARALFGLVVNTDYRGRDLVELCRDPRLQEFVGNATAAGGMEVKTAEFQIHNPASHYLHASASPVRQAPDSAAARVFVFHDLTQLKSYETLRADFVANLTHELRTPLSAVRGYAETLLQGVDDRETERRFLGIIERQSRRLARLIDDLLSLSDLERGLTPLKFEPLEPRKIVDEAVELMREQATRGGITLQASSNGALPTVSGDHGRIHEVMVNLLDNALKYTPRGGNVTVEASQSDHPDAPGVEFRVTDTGEGIPAADIPRLTERFYRVDRARSRELGGTGLGLAIVKHILQLHHGSLKIESRLREGTTVAFWLPLQQP